MESLELKSINVLVKNEENKDLIYWKKYDALTDILPIKTGFLEMISKILTWELKFDEPNA